MRDLVSTSSNFVEAIINYINMLITNIIFLSGVDSHVIYTREWNNSDLVNSIKITKLKTPTIYSSNYGCSVTRRTSLVQHKPMYTISSAVSPHNCIVLVQVVLAFKLYGTRDYQFKGFTCNHMIKSRTLLLCVLYLVLWASSFYIKKRERVWRMNLHPLVPRSSIWTTNEIAAGSQVTR